MAMRPFFRGLIDSLSIGVGYVPVAMSFGLTAVYTDLSPLMAVFISMVVYAGASQFILVSLLASGSSAASIVGIVLLMNMRHLFYGPVILGKFDKPYRRWPVFLLAAGLTDEVFAASAAKLAQQAPEQRESWYAGLQLGAYLAWVSGTAAGAYFGRDWIQQSEIVSQALGFVLPALFFALLLELRQIVPAYVLAGVALVTLVSTAFLPAYGAITIGMLTGALLGARRA